MRFHLLCLWNLQNIAAFTHGSGLGDAVFGWPSIDAITLANGLERGCIYASVRCISLYRNQPK
jgi:hypothetical protein